MYVSHQCGSGLILAQFVMWVEFVVGSLLALLEGFSLGYQIFLPPQKPTSPYKFQFEQDRGPA